MHTLSRKICHGERLLVVCVYNSFIMTEVAHSIVYWDEYFSGTNEKSLELIYPEAHFLFHIVLLGAIAMR